MTDIVRIAQAYEAWTSQQRYRDKSAEAFSDEVETLLASSRWLLLEEGLEGEAAEVKSAVARVRDTISMEDVLDGIFEG